MTDRLHVAIGSALCGVPCKLHDNCYGKNRAVYDQSFVGRFLNVSMASDHVLGL